MTPEEEESIIQSVIKGDTQAFRPLVELYLPKLQRFLAPLVTDFQAREDIAQETLIRAFRNLSSYDPNRSQFKTWIYVIAKRLAFQSLKKHRPIPMEFLPETTVETSPGSNIDKAEQLSRIHNAIQQLPPKYKIIIELAEIEGCPLSEIARLEGKPVGTIKSRAFRARARLKKILSHANNETNTTSRSPIPVV